MSGLIVLIGENDEEQGRVTMGPDKVEWSYTGPDPEGKVKEYLKLVEDKEFYDWHPEVRGLGDIEEERFNKMYLTEIWSMLDFYDYPHRLILRV